MLKNNELAPDVCTDEQTVRYMRNNAVGRLILGVYSMSINPAICVWLSTNTDSRVLQCGEFLFAGFSFISGALSVCDGSDMFRETSELKRSTSFRITPVNEELIC